MVITKMIGTGKMFCAVCDQPSNHDGGVHFVVKLHADDVDRKQYVNVEFELCRPCANDVSGKLRS